MVSFAVAAFKQAHEQPLLWRMPELAHTQATLSNSFAEVCKYDSDHAEALAVPHTARDRPVFGEVRLVIDEVLLGQLWLSAFSVSVLVRRMGCILGRCFGPKHREFPLGLHPFWLIIT